MAELLGRISFLESYLGRKIDRNDLDSPPARILIDTVVARTTCGTAPSLNSAFSSGPAWILQGRHLTGVMDLSTLASNYAVFKTLAEEQLATSGGSKIFAQRRAARLHLLAFVQKHKGLVSGGKWSKASD